MCGIAGIIDHFDNINLLSDNLHFMQDSLIPRGPDEKGIYISKSAALAHTRLSIIDPKNGKQPMTATLADKKYTIVYNGELYNSNDVLKKLRDIGCDIKSHSDTEILLNAYIHFGKECLSLLNGIFSFAVYDESEDSLFMARDRIGVKPLFYSLKGNKLIFASEIKALLASKLVSADIDKYSLAEIFLIGPGRTCGNGIFKDISEIKPGYYATYKNGVFTAKPYWKLKAKKHDHDIFETTYNLNKLIVDSIERQTVSDVPICTFLSGGLDSSIITAVVSKKIHKLHTFSVGYTDNEKYFKASHFQPNSDDEYIGIMCQHACTTHHAVTVGIPELIESLYDAAEARDLPGMVDVDSSLLIFCSEIKKHAKVALSGECADELFGGYPWYHDPSIYNSHGFPWSRSTSDRLKLIKKGVLSGINAEDYIMQKYYDTIKSADCLETDSPLDKRMREMFMLNFYWFMQTLLDRKDRMSMANGLEVRVPFCDHRIAEYAYNIPWSLKAFKGREKGILREAAKDLLPPSIVQRKKSPYPKTHNPLYTKLVIKQLKDVLNNSASPILDIVDKDHIFNMMSDENIFKNPIYGQLMTRPQVFAYLLQINHWLKKYNVNII